MRKEISYDDFLKITDKEHIRNIMNNPVNFLKESGKGFFVEKEGYAIAIRDELKDIVGNKVFARHMRDVIEYRTMDYSEEGIMKMNKTIEYYDKNSALFVETTQKVDLTSMQEKFLEYIPDSGRILDFGCGAGRDTKYFIDKGYAVDAIDGSKKMCEAASEYTGIEIKHQLFEQFRMLNSYDGIWACSSILHLKTDELNRVMQNLCDALKENGVIYTSFKYGLLEGYRGDRYFTDFTEEKFEGFVSAITKLKILEEWITADVRPGRGEEKWLNLLLKKV